MSRVIWKFPLSYVDEQTVDMPAESTVLHAGIQDGVLCVWALVDPDRKPRGRKFYVVGTGNPSAVDGSVCTHVGTVINEKHKFVWHVFTRG